VEQKELASGWQDMQIHAPFPMESTYLGFTGFTDKAISENV
jgi:hypothetical protein